MISSKSTVAVEPEMIEEARKSKRKAKKQRPTQSRISEEFITGIITLTVFVLIFLFMAGHSHVQLDLMNENSKIFVKNKFGVLRKELDAMEVHTHYIQSCIIILFLIIII